MLYEMNYKLKYCNDSGNDRYIFHLLMALFKYELRLYLISK